MDWWEKDVHQVSTCVTKLYRVDEMLMMQVVQWMRQHEEEDKCWCFCVCCTMTLFFHIKTLFPLLLVYSLSGQFPSISTILSLFLQYFLSFLQFYLIRQLEIHQERRGSWNTTWAAFNDSVFYTFGHTPCATRAPQFPSVKNNDCTVVVFIICLKVWIKWGKIKDYISLFPFQVQFAANLFIHQELIR